MTDRTVVDEVVQIGVLAADFEALTPNPPMSAIRNPDGSQQRETAAEYTRRIVSTAIRHLIDVGLLEVAEDAERRITQEGIPIRPSWVE